MYDLDPRKTGIIVVSATTGIIVLFILIMTIMSFIGRDSVEEIDPTADYEKFLITKAKTIYNEQASIGVSMINGPCLSNNLDTGWVLDVVNDPRTAIDNLEENQCEEYINGNASHFIELDTEGNLIRMQ
jgi:hypothetical protein